MSILQVSFCLYKVKIFSSYVAVVVVVVVVVVGVGPALVVFSRVVVVVGLWIIN